MKDYKYFIYDIGYGIRFTKVYMNNNSWVMEWSEMGYNGRFYCIVLF